MGVDNLRPIDDIKRLGMILFGFSRKTRHHISPEYKPIDALSCSEKSVEKKFPVIPSFHAFQDQGASTLHGNVQVRAETVRFGQGVQKIIGEMYGIYGTQSHPERARKIDDFPKQGSQRKIGILPRPISRVTSQIYPTDHDLPKSRVNKGLNLSQNMCFVKRPAWTSRSVNHAEST